MAKAQAPKVRRSEAHQARVLDLRRSNAAQPHKAATVYSRKPKHKGRGWE